MIGKIKHIKNLGVFDNWTATADLILNKYNLFYGWNGSGKSTLSKVLRSIENKKPIEGFSNYEFELETIDPVTTINEKFETIPPNIKVFNSEFIRENTRFDHGTTESILYIGKDKGDLKEEIDDLKANLLEEQNKYNSNTDNLQRSIDKQDSFFIESGKELKMFFSNTIFTQINYNRKNAADIWEVIKETTSLIDCTLDDYALNIHTAFISQNQAKFKYDLTYSKIVDFDKALYNEVVDILNTNPIIKTIDRLKKHNDIANWVQAGIALHNEHQSNNCEFCGEKLKDEKILQLSEHFNDEFVKFQNRIREKQKEIEKLFVPEIIIDSNKFYADYESAIKLGNQQLKDTAIAINEGLKFYLNLLDSKLQNPLQHPVSTQNIGPGNFTLYNQSIETINSIINHHNDRVLEYDTEAKNRKEALEKHFVAKRAIEGNFKSLLGSIALQTKAKLESEASVDAIREKIKEKEILLQDEEFAIIKINDSLHRFLGRNEILLEKNEAGGYNLIRNKTKALNLSEGEKTAIALIYFIVKITEKDNEIENTIIVLDDPISSLDSNHLFNAASYITTNCQNAKQLIVLTHNFWFFKLMRDWIKNKNNNRIKKNKSPLGSFFEIKKGSICFADKSLIEYNSEYHYVFKKLSEFESIAVPGLNESFVIANTARRVLESFSTIKIPHSPGLTSILDIAKKKGIGSDVTEKIYFFLNKYSHLDRIENFENTIENITGESNQIVTDVMAMIQIIDEDHYVSMKKLCDAEEGGEDE